MTTPGARLTLLASGLCLALLAGCQFAPSHAPARTAVASSAPAPDPRDAGPDDPGMSAVQEWIDRVGQAPRHAAAPAEQTRSDSDGGSAFGPPLYSLGPPPPPEVGPPDSAAQPPAVLATSQPVAQETPQPKDHLRPPTIRTVSAVSNELAVSERPAPSASVNSPAVAAADAVPRDLRELLDHFLRAPSGGGLKQQLDYRLLKIVAGDYDAARQPLTLVSDEQQRLAAGIIEMLIDARQAHGGEPASELQRIRAGLARLDESLLPFAELNLSNVVICRAVRGFGQYEAMEPALFVTGRPIEFVLYCELRDFASKTDAAGLNHSEFALHTSVLSHAGDLVEQLDDPAIVDNCRVRRRDCFIPRLVQLPATLSPGEYVVKVRVVDKIVQKVAEKRVTFRVSARP